MQDVHHINTVHVFKTKNRFIRMLFINSSYLFISVTKYNKTSCLDPLIQLFNTTERSARQILIQFFFFKDRWSPHYKVKILRTSLLDFPLIQQQNTCVCSYFKCSLSFNLYRTKNKIEICSSDQSQPVAVD